MSAKLAAERIAEICGKMANLRRENARLQAIVDEFARVVYCADASRTLYCGFYTAKEYHFTQDQIERYKSMINPDVSKIDDDLSRGYDKP